MAPTVTIIKNLVHGALNFRLLMGNQITGTVPTQILPLDSYFNELQEYSKPHRLESVSDSI